MEMRNDRCYWKCQNCGKLRATNIDAQSENTYVPCSNPDCEPHSVEWKRMRKLEGEGLLPRIRREKMLWKEILGEKLERVLRS